MNHARASSVAWTTIVVACATLALVGITTFMAHVHRSWNRTRVQVEATPFEAGELPAAPTSGGALTGERAGVPSGAHEPDVADAPATPAPRGSAAPAALVAALRERALTMPVPGIPADALVPAFDQDRGGRPHEAIDIMAPAGTPVVAVEDGRIAKLFTSKAGGLTVYQFDPTQTVAYYYAHLERYAPGLSDGTAVKRGQVIGYVGSSGNADPQAPHLHFAIFRLGPERRWWEGTAIDPYEVLR